MGEQDPTLHVPITGMTCRACEVRIAKAVRRVPGVVDADVSVRSASAEVALDPSADAVAVRDAVEGAIRTAGYDVGRSPWLSREGRVWRDAAIAVGVVAVAALLLVALGIPDLVAGSTSMASGSLLVVLLVGLAAGVSTCMALVGGLVLAVSASHAARVEYETGRPASPSLRPQVAFHVGRVVGFALLGALLGALGATVAVPIRLQAVLTLAVALVMVVLGVRLLRVSPRVAGWSPTLPPSLARLLGLEDRGSRPYSDVRTALLGALTFLLPCGFTQAMQLYALSTGSAVTAGAVMAVFALGTTPGLLALGGLPTLASGPVRDRVLAVTGAMVLAFALVNAWGAAGLFGWTSGSGRDVPVAVSANVTLADGVQTVTMDQTERGYVPQTTVVHAGVPIRWVVTSVSDLTCAAYVRGVSDPGWSVNLRTGRNVVDLPPLAPGSWDFTCVMGMYSGSLVAIES